MYKAEDVLNHIPTQMDKFGHSQAMPITEQDHGSIAVAVPPNGRSRVHEALYFGIGFFGEFVKFRAVAQL
jgi:hypothetical protein